MNKSCRSLLSALFQSIHRLPIVLASHLDVDSFASCRGWVFHEASLDYSLLIKNQPYLKSF
jgi:hypothetical protein